MNDSIFLDTNVLVYAHTDLDTVKQATAQKLMEKGPSFVSTQVLQELANTLNKKFKHSWEDIGKVLTDVTVNNNLHINDEMTIRRACQLADRYRFSFYDSMIVSAALESNCSVLYSEDLHNGQVIEGTLTIKSPF